jgi:hypothetical protein
VTSQALNFCLLFPLSRPRSGEAYLHWAEVSIGTVILGSGFLGLEPALARHKSAVSQLGGPRTFRVSHYMHVQPKAQIFANACDNSESFQLTTSHSCLSV